MSPPAGVVDGLLADRYRLVSRLGAGGNGEVWRAHDERLGRDVAVKVLRPELADDDDVRARFRAEARSAGGLHHPGVAAVFDFAEDDDGAWLVMELVDGAPLSAVLRQEGRLEVDRVLDVVGQAAGALQAAHDGGVVHRDVKPANLLLRPDGRLSITDFGIAHATGTAALTRTGQVVGTAAYLSPEQASGQPVGPAADLYALGVVAHECLSGVRPFERDDPLAVLLAHLQAPPPPLPPDVPAPVADLVHRLLAKAPDARPPSAAAVQREASALRHHLTAGSRPTTVLPSAVPPAAMTPTPALPADGRTAVLRGGPATRPSPLGLAERPGQRRAVRATAVALGLLALALGVRDATTDDQPAPVTPTPVSSAPAAPAPSQPAAEEPAPVVQEPAQEQEPVEEQEPAREQAPAEQPVDEQPAPEQPGSQQDRVEDDPEDAPPGQQRKEQREREREDRGRGGGG